MKLYGSLDNYINMHRKRVGLSQAELAVLVSVENRGSLSRYELGLRFPDLETLLALELILGEPMSRLFAGITERVRDRVANRAQSLLETLSDSPTSNNRTKLELLSRLAHPDDEHIVPVWEEET